MNLFLMHASKMASRQDTSMGELDFRAVQKQVQDASSGKRNQYVKYSDVDRFDIGKYANENGPAAAVRKFSSRFTALNESTVRTFRKKYREEVKKANMESRAVLNKLSMERRGRPLMLGDVLDKKIQDYIKVKRKHTVNLHRYMTTTMYKPQAHLFSHC